MVTWHRQPSPKEQQSPYSRMFSSIAAKEGVSDAQEIMQDRVTEIDGAAFAMGSEIWLLGIKLQSLYQ
jgi:hypothetical protein